MEPVVLVVGALAAGAAVVAEQTIGVVVKDAYDVLKRRVHAWRADAPIEDLEMAPASKEAQARLQRHLEGAGTPDAETVAAAQALLEATWERSPSALHAVGVHLRDVEGGGVTVYDVESAGDGVRIEGMRVAGELRVGKVRSGSPPRNG